MQWVFLIMAWIFMAKAVDALPPNAGADAIARAVVTAGYALASGLCCLSAAVAGRPSGGAAPPGAASPTPPQAMPQTPAT